MSAARPDAGVEVRGNATADEVAAVLASLAEIAARTVAPSRYERWRQERIVALRRTDPR